MKTNNIATILSFIIISIVAVNCGESPTIKVGVGETTITPEDPSGIYMSGFDRGGNTSTGVHDDLHTRSMVVEGKEGNTVAMLSVSVIGISESIQDDIREGIVEQTQIPSDNILISATHTHSGPSLSDRNEGYVQHLVKRSIQSAVQAWNNRVPGKIGVGTTEIIGLGKKRAALGHGGVHPDPEVGIIKIENASDELMGVFYNYGAHPATLNLHNLQLSEDWPHFSSQGIKDDIGNEVVVGLFQGASGDINTGYTAELSAVGAYMYGARSFEYAKSKGHILSDAVLEILPSIDTSGDMVVKTTNDRINFPRRTTYPYTHEEALQWQEEARANLEKMKNLVAAYPTTAKEAKNWKVKARDLGNQGQLDTENQIGPRTFDQYKVELWLAEQAVRRAKAIEELPEDPDPIQMPVQSFRIGDAVFVAFPNEVYSEIGLAVKNQSPYDNTFIFSMSGGRGGYIPTAAEYLEGGYVANGSPFAPAAEQVLINASLELIGNIDN